MTEEPAWLTVKQAAARYAAKPDYLRDEWRAGRLALKDIGRGRRPVYIVSVEEMDRWANDLPDAQPRRAS